VPLPAPHAGGSRAEGSGLSIEVSVGATSSLALPFTDGEPLAT
jgi:hypothetical protein